MKGTAGGILAVLLVIGLLAGGAMYFDLIPQKVSPDTGGGKEKPQTTTSACGDDNLGEIRAAVKNPLNASGNQYSSVNLRVYKDSIASENYKGTLTTGSDGYTAQGNGYSAECGETYVLVSPAKDGVRTSGKTTVTVDGNDVTTTLALEDQAGTVFKAYDEDARAKIYATSANSTDYVASGSTFYSPTEQTPKAVGTNGDFDYTMSVKVDGTDPSLIYSQFNDQKLIVCVDAQDLSDWQEPSITPSTGSLSKMSDVPTKISNDGYDWCYELKGVDIRTSPVDLEIYGMAQSGVDPSDNIKVGLFTSGWYANTQDEGASVGFNKDDSSHTYVYTGQTATFSFS